MGRALSIPSRRAAPPATVPSIERPAAVLRRLRGSGPLSGAARTVARAMHRGGMSGMKSVPPSLALYARVGRLRRSDRATVGRHVDLSV